MKDHRPSRTPPPSPLTQGHETAGQTIWSGTISFSLVAIPVHLVKAVDPGRVSFRLLHRTDYSPLLRRMVCPKENKVVPPDEIIRGYEIGPDKYILVTDEELESVSPERSRTIEIVEFIDLADVDPIYFDHPYYLVPARGGEKAYRLLVEVMRRTRKAGIAKFVLGEREYLVAVRSAEGALSLVTLHYSEEILSDEEIAPSGGKIDPGEKSRIHAHEHTFEGPKADRLKLLRSTCCNLSSVFCLYSDAQYETDRILADVMAKEPPRMELTDDDHVTHRLWLMSDRAQIKRLSGLMQDKDFFIADGHHRYETAVRYYQEMRKSHGQGPEGRVCPPSAYVMAFLTNCDSPGLRILPTHRVLSRELGEGVEIAEVLDDLKEHFEVTPVKVDLKKAPTEGPRLLEKLQELGKNGTAFAMVLPGGKGYYLALKSREAIGEEIGEDVPADIAALDASVLHQYIVPQVWVGNPEMEFDDHDIFYVKDAADALKMLGAPTFASAVFLMNAPSVEQVRKIAMQNLRMPHKSTYFYPKLLTGLVLRDHTVA